MIPGLERAKSLGWLDHLKKYKYWVLAWLLLSGIDWLMTPIELEANPVMNWMSPMQFTLWKLIGGVVVASTLTYFRKLRLLYVLTPAWVVVVGYNLVVLNLGGKLW